VIELPTIYGSALVVLGCWAAFTTSKTLTSRGGWTEHRNLVVIGSVFVAACLLPGVAMLAEGFRSWMLIPLGLCYLALIPFPCYWTWANRGRMRTARTILFTLVGVGFVAAGLDLLPLSWFGL
jgi:hypothetical protein